MDRPFWIIRNGDDYLFVPELDGHTPERLSGFEGYSTQEPIPAYLAGYEECAENDNYMDEDVTWIPELRRGVHA